ncbi:MAG: tetratricopeptide repeat protein [Acidobacteriota bacterium]|nr:tetratricopeptide repeat protein [Acidobacteriota bacterium]
MHSGVTGVVAMRYNVYVDTAARFVADLYAALCRGNLLGEAVTVGRKILHNQPLREIGARPVTLQDWCVPVVFEAAAVPLFTAPVAEETPKLQLGEQENTNLDPELPRTPDVGFYGRDETILALDRAFDTEKIVLLHAYAGSGKTTAAAEFARWYSQTGGVPGPVLFTSFERYLTLTQVLNKLEYFFGPLLEQNGIHWLALDDKDRRLIALQLLKQIPILWIWDNVEPIAGFPKGSQSAWTGEEQEDLLNFLRDIRDTQARVLLTSRRREEDWLGMLPTRIAVGPMPMLERAQLAEALVKKQGGKLKELSLLNPLLEFTQGNPLTITVLVGQAVRDRLTTKREIDDFVTKLRRGEARFADEAAEGRSKSLGASLGYGFEHAFDESQRKQLALLHFFQGFVNVEVLTWMGDPKADWCLAEIRGLSREAGTALLDRAAEVGLLDALGGGYYRIHPALPWYFKSLFDAAYPTEPKPPGSSPQAAARAFVEAMGELGNYYHAQYGDGNREVIGALTAEEANLLFARSLARRHGWWHRIISNMQGLGELYGHTGRRAEWVRLVEEIVPDFVDPETNGPLSGREEKWSLVTQYRVHLAKETRQWKKAEELQKARVEWNRKAAAPFLEADPKTLTDAHRNTVRTLMASLHDLGEIQRKGGDTQCVQAYEASLAIAEQIEDRPGAATCAYNLGSAYEEIDTIRDLKEAESWYCRSYDLRDDNQGHGRCLTQLGYIALERFKEAKATEEPGEVLLKHLQDAERYYLQALELIPANAVNDRAVAHTVLGNIYGHAGQIDQSLQHNRDAIRLHEAGGNIYVAGQTRSNAAVFLLNAGRLEDAQAYALAALRNFQTFGDRAAGEIQNTQNLIQTIETAIKNRNG